MPCYPRSCTSLIALLAMAHAAAGPARLTSVEDSYPWPAPDGASIVFESDRTGVDQIYRMDADGSNLHRLTDIPGGAESPVLSPDGKWIVFAAFVDGDGRGNDVFVMSAEGGDPIRLTRGPGYDGHPHWSADGERIIFNSDRTTPDLEVPWHERWHEIFSMRRDGSDVRQHTRCRSVCTYGSLSPDGRRILFRKTADEPGFNWYLDLGQRNSQVFSADLDGNNEVNLSASAAYDGWPRWSPDGSKIAFASTRASGARQAQVFIMNADGSGLLQLTEGEWSHTQPAWSADGQRIYAYQSREGDGFETGGVAVIELSEDQMEQPVP